MTGLPDNKTPDSYMDIRRMSWSHAEKAIARKAFERSLQHELETLVHEAKQMAAKIEQPSELWDLVDFLVKRRDEIDRKYDFRYSILPEVFGVLVREGRVSEEELRGLAEEKLAYIRKFAKF